ncbi:electroneutral sodium bicarbonate exchanger 1-like isoform X2 [Heliangelus exortis]|uniref:electroneutral sodium bicarbonate exchanger 1-like isoform X2 n=1 Tax=Heliangelus exortis TaxID=472823 RepID=UPI003A9561E6
MGIFYSRPAKELQACREEALLEAGRSSNGANIHPKTELEGTLSLYNVQLILESEEDEEHEPHDLFMELDEICVEGDKGAEWKEKARWLKFEEVVEAGGERWSKPFVSTLSMHSIFELQRYISNGTVLLDVSAKSIEEAADIILSQPEQVEEFDKKVRAKVREILLKRHCHQHDKDRKNLLAMVCSAAGGSRQKKQTDPQCLDREVRRTLYNLTDAIGLSKAELHFMRKIPIGAEACNVLVGKLDFLHQPIVAFLRLAPGVLFMDMTEVPIPTRFLFVLLGPGEKPHEYYEVGRSMATLMTDEVFRAVAYKARNRADLVSGIMEFQDRVTVLPPGAWDPSIRIEPPRKIPLHVGEERRKLPGASHSTPNKHSGPELQWTRRFFGGLIQDVKRKAPWFWSDFQDGLNLQCLAAFLFLYSACMFPVITLGGLLEEATGGQLSTEESLLGAALSGVVYSLFSGQPLTILGLSGHILVFEKVLYKFCVDNYLSYLSLRACIGLWICFFCIVLVATDASCLVSYVTRFTEEAFATLVCIFFIYEAVEKLIHLHEVYPVHMPSKLDYLTNYYCKCEAPVHPGNETLQFWQSNNINVSGITWGSLTVTECISLHGEFHGPACGHSGPYTPNIFLWCCILFFSTFVLCTLVKTFKTSRYFPSRVQSILSDFGVSLTIIFMVLTDYLSGIPSPKLHASTEFMLTTDGLGWINSPIGSNPWWTALVALIPALLCTILIVMEQQITALIVNRNEHKLKKGCGYHLDLFVVAVILGMFSLLGLPWFVATAVLSLSHVNSLRVESSCSAPGEEPKFLGVREQRVTGLMIFVLIGCSVFFTSVLKFVPTPVLYGIFLYMGVSSLQGIQFFERLKLFGMPAKRQPDFTFLRHVPLRKVHLFTLIQLFCLIPIWVIKVSRAAIIFPMMVFALVFVRKLMDFCFSKQELSFLDDLMPESKKKLDDEKNEANAEEEVQKIMASFAESSAHTNLGETSEEDTLKRRRSRCNFLCTFFSPWFFIEQPLETSSQIGGRSNLERAAGGDGRALTLSRWLHNLCLSP